MFSFYDIISASCKGTVLTFKVDSLNNIGENASVLVLF